MGTQLDLLEEIWYYYNTHTQEEIAELWKEIEQEKHVGPTCEKYKNFLNENNYDRGTHSTKK